MLYIYKCEICFNFYTFLVFTVSTNESDFPAQGIFGELCKNKEVILTKFIRKCEKNKWDKMNWISHGT